MKNKFFKNDKTDEFLFNLAKKDYKTVPEEIHNNIMNTIQEIYNDNELPNSPKKKKCFKFSFKDRLGSILTTPLKTLTLSFIAVVLVTTGVVGANKMSEKFFKKDNVRLDDIGISNEFIFTDEMEEALIQNVPLNLIKLNEDYYINVHSILLDEINFFTVFELHCKNGVTDDLRFIIRDLEIRDENNYLLYASNIEGSNYSNKGYNHIYNTENSIKELYFMFGNNNSKIKKLNFSFSNIDIYKHNTQINSNPDFKDIHIISEKQTINIPINKDNYNTIQEYAWEKENSESTYNIEQTLLTKTGLYITIQSESLEIAPFIKVNNTTYPALYRLPLKRIGRNKILVLVTYNVREKHDIILLYNNIDKNTYKLIQKNI